MILLTGKVKHKAEVSRALGKAPEMFRKGMLGALLTERDMFVGRKNRDGAFTRKLMRKTSVRGEKWPRNVARIFGGRVDNGERLEGMSLVMGVGESGRTKHRHKAGRSYGIGTYTGVPFLDVMDFLNVGGSVVPKKNQFMVMPVYKNLINKSKARKQWHFMRDNNMLTIIRKGNKILYFQKNGYGDERDLLFIGIRYARISRQYNFQGDWLKRQPRAFDRIQKKIDRVTDRIDKAKM